MPAMRRMTRKIAIDSQPSENRRCNLAASGCDDSSEGAVCKAADGSHASEKLPELFDASIATLSPRLVETLQCLKMYWPVVRMARRKASMRQTSKRNELVVPEAAVGERLDRWVVEHCPDLSRARVQE